MQFHHHGYVSGNPRVHPAAGVGLERPSELPDEVDVLIVGSGPAGMIAAAQLAQFPNIVTRVVERRPGRLKAGQADGIQARSVETFQAFGLANRITEEAHRITQMAFWKPDPQQPENIARTGTRAADPPGVSEFPQRLVNQARVLDYFTEAAYQAATRLEPDYGYEVVTLHSTTEGEYPVSVTLRDSSGPQQGRERP